MNNRRDMIAMMSTALFATGAAPVAAKTGPWIKDRGDAQHITAPFGEVRIYFKGETEESRLLELLNVRIDPGLSPHPPHEHPEEELLLVVERRGRVSVGRQGDALLGRDNVVCGTRPLPRHEKYRQCAFERPDFQVAAEVKAA